mmetsp:Transcript_25760/g.67263  ORF Transcript_25760/g.67263 Transcript_25760/m.67263 type:complete len:93 (-) Transcript_25760:208-486(-)
MQGQGEHVHHHLQAFTEVVKKHMHMALLPLHCNESMLAYVSCHTYAMQKCTKEDIESTCSMSSSLFTNDIELPLKFLDALQRLAQIQTIAAE